MLVAGWHFTPGFQLRRDGPTLRELLAEVAERVECGSSPGPARRCRSSSPSRGDVRAMRDALRARHAIRVALDARERPMHCHHEKLVVVDDEVAYVGGIDLTSLAGNRLDTPEHRARGELGWHDAAARIEGPLSPTSRRTSRCAGTR